MKTTQAFAIEICKTAAAEICQNVENVMHFDWNNNVYRNPIDEAVQEVIDSLTQQEINQFLAQEQFIDYGLEVAHREKIKVLDSGKLLHLVVLDLFKYYIAENYDSFITELKNKIEKGS